MTTAAVIIHVTVSIAVGAIDVMTGDAAAIIAVTDPVAAIHAAEF